MQKLKYCFQFFKGNKAKFCLSTFLLFFRSVLTIASPILYSELISSLLNSNIQKLWLYLALIISLQLIGILIKHFNILLDNIITKNINLTSKQFFIKHFLKIPPFLLHDYSDGKIYSVINNDTNSITSYVYSLRGGLQSIITIIGIGAVLLYISPLLTLVIVVTCPISIIVNRLYKKRLQKLAKEAQMLNDDYLSFSKNSISNLSETKRLNAIEKMNALISNKLVSINNLSFTQSKSQLNHSTIVSVIDVLQSLLLLGLGSWFVLLKFISFGNFIAVNTYSKSFSSSLNSIVQLNASLQPNIVAINRLQELNSIPVSDKDNKNSELTAEHLPITLNSVCYGVNNIIINNISAVFNEKSVSGLIGKNGSGKTTIANLITKILNPTSGDILIGKNNIKDCDYSFIQHNISYIAQNPQPFYVSLYDNLTMGDELKEVEMKDIRLACEKVGLLKDIENLPDGFDTIITEKIKLSAGQLKKIQFVRAILQNKPIIILDEPTSSLDAETKEILLNVIINEFTNKTILLITHNEDEIKLCDKVYSINNKTLELLNCETE